MGSERYHPLGSKDGPFRNPSLVTALVGWAGGVGFAILSPCPNTGWVLSVHLLSSFFQSRILILPVGTA